MSTNVAPTIENALAERYAAPEYAFLLQVRNGTGFQRQVRTADALAFGLYPSRGLTVIGFEIKVSKSDWKRELENPDKAEDIARFCHTWNIVAPKGVVPIDEVPINWGLIELGSTGKLRTAKAAATQEPEPLSRLMLASVMRNISNGMIPRSSFQQHIDDAVLRAREAAEREVEIRTREHTRLREMMQEFEEASGVHVDHWSGGRIGAAVRTVMRYQIDPDAYMRRLRNLRSGVQLLDEQLEETIEQIGKTIADGSDGQAR